MENDPPSLSDPSLSQPPPLSQSPPPPSPPPPQFPQYFPPSRPAPPRRGGGWKIVALVLFLLLGLSLFFNLGSLTSSLTGGHAGRRYGPQLEETVLEEVAHTRDKIAVISVHGIIAGQGFDGSGYGMVDVIGEQLRRAKEDRDVKAVILRVDSPGGEVLASDDIYKLIADFQSDSGKPVIASMGGLAASGGYYVAAPCRWIVANELTITGSIGVIMHGYNFRGLLDKIGVRPEIFKSGKHKDMLSPDKREEDISAEEKEMIQALINETYDKFKGIVLEGRTNAHALNKDAKNKEDQGRELAKNWQQYADGRILSGKGALELGLVDELGDFGAAVKRTLFITGLKGATLVEYQPIPNLLNMLRLFGESEAKGVKIDLGTELPKIKAGRLYFLSPTYLR